MTIRHTLFIALCAVMFACSESEEKKDTASTPPVQVNVSDKAKENEDVARDIVTLDFASLVAEKLNITDPKVLQAILLQAAKDSVSGAVNISLSIGKDAELYRNAIEKLYKEFTSKKISEYNNNKKDLDLAERSAAYYLFLIEKFGIDSVWPNITPTFTKFASKEQLTESFKRRKELFMPLGKRRIISRRIADSIATGVNGKFCTITYEYQNHDHEEITMEKVDSAFKFLGYNFIYIPQKTN